MDTENTFDALIDFFGTQTAMAERFGLDPMAISQWKRRGIPVKHCPRIVELTDGQFSLHQLRPDVFPAPKRTAA